MELRNATSLEFTDITSERERRYAFKSGTTLIITAPVALNVSASGGHRVLDSDGYSYYIPGGSYDAISWLAKDDQPHFVK
jgi:hypothetical protein